MPTLISPTAINTAQEFSFSNVVADVVDVSVGIVANGTSGTAGQVLTSNGTSSYWAAAASGTTNFVSSGNISQGNVVVLNTNGTVSTVTTTTVPDGNRLESANVSAGVHAIQNWNHRFPRVFSIGGNRFIAHHAASQYVTYVSLVDVSPATGAITIANTIAWPYSTQGVTFGVVNNSIFGVYCVWATPSDHMWISPVTVSGNSISVGGQTRLAVLGANQSGTMILMARDLSQDRFVVRNYGYGIQYTVSFQYDAATQQPTNNTYVGTPTTYISGASPQLYYDTTSNTMVTLMIDTYHMTYVTAKWNGVNNYTVSVGNTGFTPGTTNTQSVWNVTNGGGGFDVAHSPDTGITVMFTPTGLTQPYALTAYKVTSNSTVAVVNTSVNATIATGFTTLNAMPRGISAHPTLQGRIGVNYNRNGNTRVRKVINTTNTTSWSVGSEIVLSTTIPQAYGSASFQTIDPVTSFFCDVVYAGPLTGGPNTYAITSGQYTGTSSDTDKWIGISTQTVTNNQPTTVTIMGGVNDKQSSLTPGSVYYVQTDGSLSTTSTSYKVGKALSANAILITVGNA